MQIDIFAELCCSGLLARTNLKAWYVVFQSALEEPKSLGTDLERRWAPCIVARGAMRCTKVFFQLEEWEREPLNLSET